MNKLPSPRPRRARPDFPIGETLETLRAEVRHWKTPVVTIYAGQKATAFMILVSTILSLRTQDKTTAEASARLFALAKTPEAISKLRPALIQKTIFPVGFYRTKARTLIELSRTLLKEHGGEVPDDLDTLLKLNGVGRKTANLVITLGYGKPGICVDTHVHRITNRWGYLKTKTPEQTESALRKILPIKYWIPINDWLVAFGQNLCKPVSPICSQCKISPHCARIGVTISR